eukprot:419128-Prymnesium_polylepis.2
MASRTSVLVASGDSNHPAFRTCGANSRTDETCSGTTLNPDFPAASPYVTTVGATQISPMTQTLGQTCPACTQVGPPSPSTIARACHPNMAHVALIWHATP